VLEGGTQALNTGLFSTTTTAPDAAASLWSDIRANALSRPYRPWAMRSDEVHYFHEWKNDKGRLQREQEMVANVTALCNAAGVQPPKMLTKFWALQMDDVDLFRKIPNQFLRHGRGWLVSQVTRFISQLSPDLMASFSQSKQTLGLGAAGQYSDTKYLALHLRGGDGCSRRGGDACITLKKMMETGGQRLVDKYGLNTVFIATGGNVDGLNGGPFDEYIKSQPGLTFLWHNDTSQKALNSTHRIAYDGLEQSLFMQSISPREEFYKFMIDTYIMVESNAMVIGFDSNVARLVYALQTAVAGCRKPFISRSQNWCWRVWLNGDEVYTPLEKFTKTSNKTSEWSKSGDALYIGDARADQASLEGGAGC